MISSSFRFLRRIIPALTLGMGLTACGEDQVPTRATTTLVSTLSATVASSVGSVPSVRILDQKGKAMKNVLVRWRVTAGNGRVVNDSVRTTPSGEASSGGWTLGTTAGLQTLQATVDGVTPVTFTARAEPGPVTQLIAVSATTQEAVVNTAVTARPSVRAEDVYSNPVPGVPITFSVSMGTGSVTGAQQTSNDVGVATVDGWTLGTQAGQQIVRASATGAQGIAFSATAVAGPAADLVKIAGDKQEAVSGIPVPISPGVRVVDSFGNPVGNIPVIFTPASGSGTVTGNTVLSDPATGTAFVGSWSLGTSGAQLLQASSPRIAGKTVAFSASIVQSLFDVDVRFIGDGANTAVRTAFATAAAKWRSIIVGDLHTTPLNVGAGTCGSWSPAINESINDVVILARIAPIDGEGKVLGQAAPCFANSRTNLPSLGLMEFDEADVAAMVANGSFTDVVLHEMGHVLGIGTLWNYRRTLLAGAASDDPYFTGPSARAQFSSLNTVTYSGNPVPVENTGSAGTRDAHWRETVLGRELMTGFLNRNVANPLSRLSIGSLQDMGYLVNLSGADPFSITASLRYAFPFVEPMWDLRDDIADVPLYVVAPDGSIRLERAASSRGSLR
jgi:hypothetical protein